MEEKQVQDTVQDNQVPEGQEQGQGNDVSQEARGPEAPVQARPEPKQSQQQEVYRQPEEARGPESLPQTSVLSRFLEDVQQGNATQWLEATATDPSSLSDMEAVLRVESQKPENQGLDKGMLERIVRRKFKLNVDPSANEDLTDEEKEDILIEQARFKGMANAARQQLAERYSDYRLSPEAIQKELEAQQAQIREEQRKYQESLKQTEEYKSFTSEGHIPYRVGEEEVVKVEPSNKEAVQKIAANPEEFWNLFLNEDGGMDTSKFFRVIQFAMDEKSVVSAIHSNGVTHANDQIRKKVGAPNPIQRAPSVNTGGESMQDKIRRHLEKKGVL